MQNRLRASRSLAVSVILLWSAACAPGLSRGTGQLPPVPGYRVYETATKGFVSFEKMVAEAGKANMVFFGEFHDDPETHRAELALLDRLGATKRPIVLSLEMFERDVQATLDAYLANQIAESDFLAKSRPWPRYLTDYRPLVELAKARGWPVIASNIPRPMASAVGRKGLAALDTLTPTERGWAAADNQCPRDGYYERFVKTMPTHSGPGGAPLDTAAQRQTVDRFYYAQCTKDEAMGESIARALQSRPAGTILVHYDGAFHSDFADGTVPRATRRMPSAKKLVISAIPVSDLAKADPAEHVTRADYIVFAMRIPAPATSPK